MIYKPIATILIILVLGSLVYASGSVNSDFFINGYSTISEYLVVGTSTRGLGNLISKVGDVLVGNRLVAEQSIRVFSQQYGIGLNVLTYDTVPEIHAGTGSIEASTQYFCDTTDPFSIDDVTDFITIESSPYLGATGEIKEFINSSCVFLSFGATNGATITDASGLSYFQYNHPVAAFLDNGYISLDVGSGVDAVFETHIQNGTGPRGVFIEDIAGNENHVSLAVHNNFKGHSGTAAVQIFSESSEDADGIHRDALQIIGDGTKVTNSHLHFIQLDSVGLGSGNDVDALSITPMVTHIIHMGSADTLSSGYVESVQRTSYFTSTTSNIEIFSNDNDYIYIGNDGNFTSVGIDLLTGASANLRLEYYYCDNTGTWQTLTGVSDSTAGMRNSGAISFPNPSDRGVCNTEYDGTPFGDSNDYTYIAIKRTRNNVLTKPVERYISISGASTYFTLAKDYMNLHPTNTAPITCDASHLGAIYFDISEDDMCQCASGGWEVIRDGSACT